jgi:hypothetical protein
VDDHVEFVDRAGELGDRFRVGDVHAQGPPADLVGELPAALEPSRGGDRVQSGGGQSAHGCGADPARGAGDEGHSAPFHGRHRIVAA